MKSILICLLLLALVLCGCTAPISPTDDDSQATTTAVTTTDPQGSESNTPLESIVRREASDYKSESFAFDGDAYYLTFSFPLDWEIYPDHTGGYTIERDNTEIGLLTTSPVTDTAWQQIEQVQNPYVPDLAITQTLECKEGDSSCAYRFHYQYSYSDGSKARQLALTVDYAEADDYTADELFGNVRLISFDENANYKMLDGIEDGTILILGNSFISSSSIGSILSEMLRVNDKDMGVRAISRGMAEVSNYIADEQIMQEIRGGNYSAVFICGFYSRTTPEELETLKAACDESDTVLVVFPAHNENRATLNNVLGKVRGVELLDWKAEVDALIDFGVDKWDMCEDDYHKHSKPLAGYVGAHMIYRAVYGESPEKDPTAVISSSTLSKLPVNYRRRACIVGTIHALG